MGKALYFIKKLIPKKLFKAVQPCYHFIFSWISAIIYRFPSEELIVIGVTGTTGKTTSVCLIAKMLESAGLKTGFTSTAIFNNGEKEWLNDKKMTMIGRLFTQKILRQMVKNKCRIAIVETTSEGIVQFRHRFINYDILVFTGLYEEHIDSHGSYLNYKNAKGKLFAHLRQCKTKYIDEDQQVIKPITGIKKIDLKRVKKVIIANGDDKEAEFFTNFWADEKYVYSGAEEQRVKWENKEVSIVDYGDIKVCQNSTGFQFNKTAVNLRLLGGFNAINAMNAVCAGLALELSPEEIKIGLEKIEGVAGRLEKIDEGQNFIVIVDYAFEPRAVTKLYETIKLLPHEKIIHVLGATGGGRDIARRPKLGLLAGENADVVIITNEDPYDDDPKTIIDQISLGAEKAGKKLDQDLFKILDRREAVKKAISRAQANDLVIITGKGSEQAICVSQGEKITWDDRAVVRSLLKNFDKKGDVDKK